MKGRAAGVELGTDPARRSRRAAIAGWLRPTALAAAGLVLLGFGALLWRSRPEPVRRESGLNVLLITIDTLRADALSCYGGERARTPFIDRLAANGVRFERAHAHNVLTLPSHANILSGRYPYEHGVRENAGFRFPAGTATLATLLHDAGYRTGAFVSGFPLDSRFGLDPGFEVYDDSFADAAGAVNFVLPERRGRQTVALARAFLDAADPRPYFAWVHLYDPHTPYRPEEPFAAEYAAAPYYGEVAAADAALGPLLEPLLEQGTGGRTLVVLTADHGEGLGDHGERTHGFFAYETTLRVPLLLYAPRLLRPRVATGQARHVDILPTVLDGLSLAPPAGLPGRSLLEMAAGEDVPDAPSYFEALSGMLTRGWAPLHGVVREGLKYIELPLPELYDLGRDAAERDNLVTRAPGPVQALQAALRLHRERDAGVHPSEESSETRDRLRALGYVAVARVPKQQRYTAEDDPKRLMELDALMQDAVRAQIEGDLQSALAACQEVVRRRPGMTAGLLQLANVHKRLGQTEQAVGVLRRAFEQDPEDQASAILLAATLCETGGAAEAARLLEPYTARAEPNVDALVTRGVALAEGGLSEEARTMFERARRIDPSNPMTLVQLATVELTRGRRQAAAAALNEALAINPRLAAAHRTLGLLARDRGDMAEAESRFRLALEIEPEEADALLNLGLLLAGSGREREARTCFERFLLAAPPDLYGRERSRIESWLSSARARS